MFKFATLASVAAASTVKGTAKKAAADAKKSVITGSSDISLSGFHMPYTETPQSYTQIQVDTTADYSRQCKLAGGAWTASKTAGENNCSFASKDAAALLKSKTPKELAAPVILDADLSWDAFFGAFDQTVAAGETVYQYGTNSGSVNPCADTWHEASFIETEAARKALHKKPASWSYTWSPDSTGANQWCSIQTEFPTKYSGNFIMTHVKNDFVNMAVAGTGTTVGFFQSQDSLKLNAIGKTGKVAVNTQQKGVHVFMQSSMTALKTAPTAADAASLTFERISAANLAKLYLSKGGPIVWVIIGILACLACVAVAILYKMGKCCVKAVEGEDGDFCEIEDSYMRV